MEKIKLQRFDYARFDSARFDSAQRKIQSRCLPILLCGMMLLSSQFAHAQDRGNPNWYVRIVPYLWYSNIGGNKTLGEEPGANFVGDYHFPVESDVLKNSWALRSEVGKGRFRGIFNLSKASMQDHAELTSLSNTTVTLPGNYDFTWNTGELFGAVQVGSFKQKFAIELLGGLRYVRHQQKIAFDAPVNASNIDQTETWIEPAFGGRFYAEMGQRFWTMFNTDIGGLGIGSNATFTLGGELGFRVVKFLDLTMRYNYQETEYDNEKAGDDRYAWHNAVQQGWFFGLVIKR